MSMLKLHCAWRKLSELCTAVYAAAHLHITLYFGPAVVVSLGEAASALSKKMESLSASATWCYETCEFSDNPDIVLACEVCGAMRGSEEEEAASERRVPRGMCANCASAKGKKRCGGCSRVRYCSRDCATKHWKAGHKAECNKD